MDDETIKAIDAPFNEAPYSRKVRLLPSLEPSEGVIAVLEDALDRARTGEITDVAVVGITSGTTFTMYHSDNPVLMAGGAGILQTRLHMLALEMSEDFDEDED